MLRNPFTFSLQVLAGSALVAAALVGLSGWALSDDRQDTFASPTLPIPKVGKEVQFACDFERDAEDCGFEEQSRVPGRASLVPIARSGRHGVRLHTEPGDDHVHGSDDWVRDDLSLDVKRTDCGEGREAWWAHSVLFPDDFVVAKDGGGVVLDFHHNASGGMANFHFNATAQGNLRMHLFGGDVRNPREYKVELEKIRRNVWYDMVYHVRWSSSEDGFLDGWMNGRKVFSYRGPTLYRGIACYLKLANYSAATREPSSIIHDRVVRGTSARAVAIGPLEGVRE